LASPSGVFGPAAEWQEFQGKFERAIEQGIDAFLPYLFRKAPPWFHLLKREFAPFLQREDTVAFMRSVSDAHRLDARLPAIQSRVWMIWGQDDDLTPAKWAKEWVAALRPGQAKAVLLKGAGHSLQLERPAVTAAVIGQILMHGRPKRMRGMFYDIVGE
jgi:pimeloyl-ACP methyl ester carboxylesterase